MRQENLSRVEEFARSFDLAFSFSELMRGTANELWHVAELTGFRAYFYTEELVRQSGIRISSLTQEIYSHLDSVIVDCDNYGRTPATLAELTTIRSRLVENDDARVFLVVYQDRTSSFQTLKDYVIEMSPQVIVVQLDNCLISSRERFASKLNHR